MLEAYYSTKLRVGLFLDLPELLYRWDISFKHNLHILEGMISSQYITRCAYNLII
jgi:hypothetical protein